MTLLVPAIAFSEAARNVVAGLVMIGVLVVIHEFGHFIVAKFFKIGVPVFSVGMGPRLFGVNFRGTDYRISALPVGGYVQMSGADPFGEEDAYARVDPELDFMKKPVWQRLLVMLAGPAFNLVLPFIVFTAVLMGGEPQTAPVIGTVVSGSTAEQIGLKVGDTITAANGEPVEVFGDVVRWLDEHPDEALQLEVKRADGGTASLSLPANSTTVTVDGYVDLSSLGIRSDSYSARVGVDDPTSPAWKAGLRIGDLITAVDGVEVSTWHELEAALRPPGGHAVSWLRASREDPAPEEMSATLQANPAWSPRPDENWRNPWGLVPVMLYVGAVRPGKDVSTGFGCASESTFVPTPAAAAGILPLDRLYRIDGNPVSTWSALTELVSGSMDGRTEAQGPRAIDVDLIREGALVTVSLTPQIQREIVRGEPRFRPLMGIERHPTAYVSGPMVNKKYGLFEAVPRAGEQGAYVFKMTIGVLWKLVTFDLKPQEALGGPVEIFRAAGAGASEGLFAFARLLGTISFSLGIVNLLPVPVLDGGQIVFYSIEGIRGRPLSLEIREKVQMVGVLGLIALMLMVTVMDVNRWLGG